MVTRKIKRLIFRILFSLGLPQKTCRDKIKILFFHGFTKAAEDPQGFINRHSNQLALSKFETYIQYLADHHRILPLRRLLDHLERRDRPPENTVVVTFDDGYASNYALAFPVLQAYGVPVEIFITTDMIDQEGFLWPDRLEYVLTRAAPFSGEIRYGDIAAQISTRSPEDRVRADEKIRALLKSIPQEQREGVMAALENMAGKKLGEAGDIPAEYRLLTWAEIREMVRSGLVSVGSHTRSHMIVTRCGPERARMEMEESKRIIEEKTETACTTFCYPNGQPGDFNEKTGVLLRELGYRCGLTTVRGYNDADSPVYELKRIPISNHHDRTGFLMALYCADGFGRMLKGIFRAA
jgi:peptidoglycan/xylan/chitin deacetylase (PgdA/CDA1 family)